MRHWRGSLRKSTAHHSPSYSIYLTCVLLSPHCNWNRDATELLFSTHMTCCASQFTGCACTRSSKDMALTFHRPLATVVDTFNAVVHIMDVTIFAKLVYPITEDSPVSTTSTLSHVMLVVDFTFIRP